MSVDVLVAVRAFLLADTDISALTAKVFVGELPQEENIEMPQKCIVMRGSGGSDNNDYREIVKPRIDIYAYGETYEEAGKVDLAVYSAMKHLMRKTISGTLLHSVACGGGPIQVKHSGTGWSIVWRSYTVTASDVKIT
jgi:hypothetical protein